MGKRGDRGRHRLLIAHRRGWHDGRSRLPRHFRSERESSPERRERSIATVRRYRRASRPLPSHLSTKRAERKGLYGLVQEGTAYYRLPVGAAAESSETHCNPPSALSTLSASSAAARASRFSSARERSLRLLIRITCKGESIETRNFSPQLTGFRRGSTIHIRYPTRDCRSPRLLPS